MPSIFRPLDDFKDADLPAKRLPNWKLTGPGAILVGLSIGAGEIIIWPRIAAEFGSIMIWAAVVGVFLQMWINLEIGRWTIATGETVYTGYCRVWRGFAMVFILLTLLAWLAPGWGRASGLALKALLLNDPDGWGSDTFWTVITFAGVALALFGPKLVYKSVERTIEALVILITIGLIVVAVAVGTADTWRDLGRGIVSVGQIADHGARRLNVEPAIAAQLDQNAASDELRQALQKDLEVSAKDAEGLVKVLVIEPGARWEIEVGKKTYPVELKAHGLIATTPPLTAKMLFIALVFAGAGGTANLFYTFYLRDKQIGMGARVPVMQNPLRGQTQPIPATGFRFADNDDNRRRFRAWWSFIRQDQIIYFWLLNTVTIMLFIFGALAVLRPRNMVPGKGQLIWDEAQILGEIWGGPGRVIFLLVGVATLFSTQLALVDGVSRSLADIVYTNFKGAHKRDVSWWYLIIAGSWIIVGCLITFVLEQRGVSDLGFLLNAAYMGGFAMAIYVPLPLFINLRYLPKSARPGSISTVMMIIASLVYVGFAIACIAGEVARWTNG